MSGFTLLSPPAIRLGAIRNTDIDSAFSLDWTANMTARADTITSFPAITVARSDGVALGPTDMTVSGLRVIAGGLKIAWNVTGNGAVATYLISVTVTTTNGNSLTRDAIIASVASLG